MVDWRTMTPAEVLAAHVVLSAEQVAYVLGLTVAKGARAGEPDSRQVLGLVTRGRLRPVDVEQPPAKWRFSKTLIVAYLDDPTMVIVHRQVA